MAVCRFDVWLPFLSRFDNTLDRFFLLFLWWSISFFRFLFVPFIFRPLHFKSGNFMMTSWWIIVVLTNSLFQRAPEMHIDLAPQIICFGHENNLVRRLIINNCRDAILWALPSTVSTAEMCWHISEDWKLAFQCATTGSFIKGLFQLWLGFETKLLP